MVVELVRQLLAGLLPPESAVVVVELATLEGLEFSACQRHSLRKSVACSSAIVWRSGSSGMGSYASVECQGWDWLPWLRVTLGGGLSQSSNLLTLIDHQAFSQELASRGYLCFF